MADKPTHGVKTMRDAVLDTARDTGRKLEGEVMRLTSAVDGELDDVMRKLMPSRRRSRRQRILRATRNVVAPVIASAAAFLTAFVVRRKVRSRGVS